MTDAKSVVLAATYKLIQPLIRILVRYGVSHAEFNNLVKKGYVEVCNRDFALPGRRTSVSRVAVLSGLNRKEVVRMNKLLEGETLDDVLYGPLNRASRVIGGWLQDSEFHDRDGNPAVLSIKKKEPCFKSLVKRYSGDVTYGAILDELLRIGAVSQTDDRLSLVTKGYIPLTADIDKIKVMGTSVKDMLNTVDHNIARPDQPRFQREVIYTQLSSAGINEFRLISRERCNELILEMNQWLANKKNIEKKLGITQSHSRTGIGIYYIENPEYETGETDD